MDMVDKILNGRATSLGVVIIAVIMILETILPFVSSGGIEPRDVMNRVEQLAQTNDLVMSHVAITHDKQTEALISLALAMSVLSAEMNNIKSSQGRIETKLDK